jgi:ubiquinone/menaquinone biosynthesis C-methylase UbiE
MMSVQRYVHRHLISPLIDLTYILMSFFFSRRSSPWYERINSWHYRRQARLYDESVIQPEGTRYAQALEAGLQAISIRPHRILDVNTGTGFVALRLRELFPQAEIGATDLSEEMLKQARSKAEQSGASIVFRRADIAQLPFADESFDLVTLHNGPPNFAEMARIVRPGGQMFIAFTSGARLPRWLLRRWLKQASNFGALEVGRTGDGLWLLIKK